MQTAVAFIGHLPALSIAELTARLPDATVQVSKHPGVLTIETKENLDQSLLDSLGGSIMLGLLEKESVKSLADVPSRLSDAVSGIKGKVVFSYRCVGLSPKEIQGLYRESKRMLKEKLGKSSRYVGNEREPAPAVLLHDEGMISGKHGVEVIVIRENGVIRTGRTVAAQNVKSYTKRDMEKPVRDTTVGLLPPKLAQILLNLGAFAVRESGKKGGVKTVLDPFCGTGVIPLESLLLGYDVLASDLSEKAVTGTKKNIEWIKKAYSLKKSLETTVWKQDAKKPFELKSLPSVIVTEGTLGPPMKTRPNVKDAEREAKRADELTREFLKNVSASLPGVPVVMTIPVWYSKTKIVHLPKVWETITEAGFKPILPPYVSPSTDGRFSLLYRRADQFVAREIIVLKPA